jgi:DNA-binding NarL/FixJ family response regulator
MSSAMPEVDSTVHTPGWDDPRPRVLIVDDERETRGLLRDFLEEEQVLVIGEAATGGEAVFMTERLHPEVVLMDVRMPGMNGIEATKRIRTRHPGTRVIILTFLGANEWKGRAEDLGAYACLVKGTPPSILVDHVKRAAAEARCEPPASDVVSAG